MLSKKNTLRAFSLLLLGFLVITTNTQQIFAQKQTEEPLGIAYQLTVTPSIPIFNGMIISLGETTYSESQGPYDRTMFGVIDLNPSIEFTFGNTANTSPVIADGTANVLVSGENGIINPGDKITSSSAPGIGMKAVKSGFTLGVAEESFAGTTASETALISIRLNKEFTFAGDTPDSETISDRLRNIVSLSAIAAFEEPTKVFKYVVAGAVLLLSILASFLLLGRTSQKGIEAIGRNPLAKNSIITSIFVNIVISIIIIIAGVVGAYLMVTF